MTGWVVCPKQDETLGGWEDFVSGAEEPSRGVKAQGVCRELWGLLQQLIWSNQMLQGSRALTSFFTTYPHFTDGQSEAQ